MEPHHSFTAEKVQLIMRELESHSEDPFASLLEPEVLAESGLISAEAVSGTNESLFEELKKSLVNKPENVYALVGVVKETDEDFAQLLLDCIKSEEVLPKEKRGRRVNEKIWKLQNVQMENLEKQLGCLQSINMQDSGARKAMQKNAIKEYMYACKQRGDTIDTIKLSLQRLVEEKYSSCSSIISEVMAYFEEKDDVIKKEPTAPPLLQYLSESTHLNNPDFVLYHSLLCSQAVNDHDLEGCIELFSTLSTNAITTVAISHQFSPKFLVAKQRDADTTYVAFESCLDLEKWAYTYESMEEGVLKLGHQVPIEYFTNLLKKKENIVFTGFSFGGLIACIVAARVWMLQHLSLETLKKRVVCITFGQPLIRVGKIEETSRDCSYFKECIHSVLIKDDNVPSVLGLIENAKCSVQDSIRHGNSVQLLSRANGHFVVIKSGIVTTSNDPMTKFSILKVVAPEEKQPNTIMLKGQGGYYISINNHEVQAVRFKTQCLLAVKDISDNYIALESTTYPGEFLAIQSNGTPYIMKGLVATDYRVHFSLCVKSREHSLREIGSTTPSKKSPVMVSPTLHPLLNLARVKQSTAKEELVVHALACLKEALLDCISKQVCHFTQGAHYYLITEENECCEITEPSEAFKNFSIFKEEDVAGLKSDMFIKHQSRYYFYKSVETFLEKIGFLSKGVGSTVTSGREEFFPELESLTIEVYDGEVVMFLKGKKMWFVTKLRLGDKEYDKVPDCVESGSVQFSGSPEMLQITSQNENVNVTVISCCHEPVSKTVTMIYKDKQIDLHQQYIARCSPFKVIELCLIIGMLEKSHHENGVLSPRYDQIKSFLYNIMTVVPIESVLCTVAYEDIDIANACCKALMTCDQKFKLSIVMHSAVLSAITRYLGCELSDEEYLEDFAYFVWLSTKCCTSKIEDIFKYMSTHENPKSEAFQMFGQMLYSQSFPEANEEETSQYLNYLKSMLKDSIKAMDSAPNAISGQNCNQLYSISAVRGKGNIRLKSPRDFLEEGREKLEELQTLSSQEDGNTSSQYSNKKMSDLLLNFQKSQFKFSVATLSRFMFTHARIPLNDKNPVTSWGALKMTIQSLFDLTFRSKDTSALLVRHAKRVEKSIKPNSVLAGSTYAGKLEFLLEQIAGRTTHGGKHNVFVLEKNLYEICKVKQILADTRTEDIVQSWSSYFKETGLQEVPKSHRELIIRWIRWTLMLYNIRLDLTQYFTVGVAGLVNSGKSELVKRVFRISVIKTGSRESRRTTVPYFYNLCRQGVPMDVVDFPGIDDRDDSIPEMINLLFPLVQIVIFVVDYRRTHTKACIEWLKWFERKNIPVLVCQTHVDRLIAEQMNDDGIYNTEQVKRQIAEESKKNERIIEESCGHSMLRTMGNYCITLPPDSTLRKGGHDGQQRLQQLGISTPFDVGKWISLQIEKFYKKKDIADKLLSFISKV